MNNKIHGPFRCRTRSVYDAKPRIFTSCVQRLPLNRDMRNLLNRTHQNYEAMHCPS